MRIDRFTGSVFRIDTKAIVQNSRIQHLIALCAANKAGGNIRGFRRLVADGQKERDKEPGENKGGARFGEGEDV